MGANSRAYAKGAARYAHRVLSLAEAVLSQRPCQCACHETLSVEERVAGVRALYVCDDALRGFGYVPIYELHGDALWQKAQKKCDPSYRGVAVRFGECLYRRLLGSLLHELIHASVGDATKANYGIPFGLPYGVPNEVPEGDEESFLAPFNFGEARAFVGVWLLGRAIFGVDWNLRTARDIGTYGFPGGNALVSVPKGFRPVAHIDRQHHAERYYTRGRKLEAQAAEWFEGEKNLAGIVSGIREAAVKGEAMRARKYPDAEVVGAMAPRKIGRNEPCTCGSAAKYKACCGRGVAPELALPALAR
jgi:SEC-C motif